jgi:hypothetical protein
MDQEPPKAIQLSISESRLALQAIGTAIEHENRALEACERAVRTLDVERSMKARQLQITEFEMLRYRMTAQLSDFSCRAVAVGYRQRRNQAARPSV